MIWPPILEQLSTGCVVVPCCGPNCTDVAASGDRRHPLLLADGRVLVFCSRACLAAWALDHPATRSGGFGRSAAAWLRRYDERCRAERQLLLGVRRWAA